MFPYQSVINFFSARNMNLITHSLFIIIISLVKTRNPCKLSLTRVILFFVPKHHMSILCLSLFTGNLPPSRVSSSLTSYSCLLLPCSLTCRKGGINTALAKRECREAHFTNNDKRYFAIAFPNISGRYEIRNRYFKGCIAPKEISHIRQSGEQRKACYVLRDS